MQLEPLHPFGAIVNASGTESVSSLLDIPREQLVELLDRYLLLVFRGYRPLEDEEYKCFARQLGPLLSWEFGEILELRISPDPANHIFTAGRVELHWDGAFVEQKPHYNIFQCLQGSPADCGGRTLFVDAQAVWQRAGEVERERWREVVIDYETEKKAHYGGAISSPLVAEHAHKPGRKVIRYIEAFNEDSAELNPMKVRLGGVDPEQSDQFLHAFTERLYRNDVMYQHVWQTGDFMIADNSSLLHGRSRFLNNNARRHIKRINVL